MKSPAHPLSNRVQSIFAILCYLSFAVYLLCSHLTRYVLFQLAKRLTP
jgi:hypothetical protein